MTNDGLPEQQKSLSETLLRETEFELHLGRGWLSAERALVPYLNRNDANGYYKALGLPPDASRSEIKTAVRKLIRRFHPDTGGDEELFMFLVDVANVLLDPKSKGVYDSVDKDFIYLGRMEREELARRGFFKGQEDSFVEKESPYWACLTSRGSQASECTNAWISFCWEVSQAVGYRGKVRVGVVDGGHLWPRAPHLPWGILTTGAYIFVLFQKGVEPNRLHALCAMIDLQKHLLNQIQESTEREQV